MDSNRGIRQLNGLIMTLGAIGVFFASGFTVAGLLGAAFVAGGAVTARRFLDPRGRGGKGSAVTLNVLGLLLSTLIAIHGLKQIEKIRGDQFDRSFLWIVKMGLPGAVAFGILVTLITLFRTRRRDDYLPPLG